MPRRDDGSVYQRHDHPSCPPTHDGTRPAHRCYGHWVAAVTLPTGRRVVRYRRTKREALDALRHLIAERDKGGLHGDNVTLHDWLNHWYTTTATVRVRPTTLAGYRSKIDQYLIPELGRIRVTRIRATDLERLYAAMSARGLSPRTIAQTHAIAHNALAKAVKQGIITTNPADHADTPPVRRQPPTVLDAAAVRRILTTAAGDRLEARWWVALTLGLRQGEALGLSWSDVDLEAGTVTIRQALHRPPGGGYQLQAPKSAAGFRTIPMAPECVAAMRRRAAVQDAERVHAANVWANPDGLVFTEAAGQPIQPSRDSKRWHELLDRAGVPSMRLHNARHTAITVWLLAGVPMHLAKRWAGHSSYALTSDTYGGLVAEMHQQGVDALAGLYTTPRPVDP